MANPLPLTTGAGFSGPQVAQLAAATFETEKCGQVNVMGASYRRHGGRAKPMILNVPAVERSRRNTPPPLA